MISVVEDHNITASRAAEPIHEVAFSAPRPIPTHEVPHDHPFQPAPFDRRVQWGPRNPNGGRISNGRLPVISSMASWHETSSVTSCRVESHKVLRWLLV